MTPGRWMPGVLGERTPRGTRCRLCPHHCVLSAGQVGACKVRRGAAGGGIETVTFASSVRHVDAVERKPFFHYRPGTPTVTLAAPGCSFRCDYCVNYRISQYGRDDEAGWGAAPVDTAAVVAQAAAAGAAVALSYTEPSLAPEMTLDLAARGRAVGVEVVWKSNGFLTPEAVAVCAPALAAVNIDLKGVDEPSHRRLTGAPAQPVVAAIRAFREHGTWVEVSTPLIPGVTDPAAVATTIAAIGTDIPWHLVRFTPAYRMQDADPTAPDALVEAVDAGRAAGLRYIYVERALGDAGRATRCPSCAATVVRRGIWSLEENLLDNGRCPGCATVLEGRW
ncbi:radical SAM protein [Dactylosporangium aurantiacum]|uniref:Radical SAM protein n=1 Tax=Dactylosporangium aurantiacum TaxID=35754 RepID=A0A9Q9IET5_9ACTN|nr:radical SAM protein [Dactylosporangium aurantiacum]MDG6101429.1 radical SAM protein [Dactylosporangium aurantiacum]UWZ52717.1 radical SAM protein [Dactylosporangium aurantiacum]